MYIQKQVDNTVAVANIKHDVTWIYVETLPNEQEFLIWNDVDPTNPTVDVAKVLQAQGQAIADAMQAHMDATAKTFGFHTGMDRAVSYLGSTNLVFKGYAETLSAWRDTWWSYAETEQAKVEAQTRTMPTVDEMFAELEIALATPVKV